MATAATIKKNIAKLEAALKSKATPKSLKSKLEVQLVKSKAELSGINKGTKPKASTTKSTQTALQKLKDMVKKNKKLKTYKGAGVDLEKDADRPALPTGRRTAKESGKTYYEYRANRIDVKQPPKRYPKLEKGGYMADGGMMAKGGGIYSSDNLYILKVLKKGQKEVAKEKFRAKSLLEAKEIVEDEYVKKYESKFGNELSFLVIGAMAEGGEMKHSKIDEMIQKYQTWLDKNNLPQMSADELLVDESVNLTKEQRKYIQDFINEWEEEQDKNAKIRYYADGGSIEKQNNDMLKSTIVEMKHHVDELKSVVSNNTEVEPWVIAKAERASTDLSDITHYLEGEKQKGLEMPFAKGGYMADGGETAKFQVDDVVYHKGHNTIGIVRLEEERGELKTDADGNVNVDELQYYNPLKHEAHKNAKIAPSTLKEIEKRGLWNPFSPRTSKLAKGGYYAKGGLTEHGLKVGDTIVDDMFWDKSVKVLNSKTGYAVVKIETGERKEMKAMGGEMHRTQE